MYYFDHSCILFSLVLHFLLAVIWVYNCFILSGNFFDTAKMEKNFCSSGCFSNLWCWPLFGGFWAIPCAFGNLTFFSIPFLSSAFGFLLCGCKGWGKHGVARNSLLCFPLPFCGALTPISRPILSFKGLCFRQGPISNFRGGWGLQFVWIIIRFGNWKGSTFPFLS